MTARVNAALVVGKWAEFRGQVALVAYGKQRIVLFPPMSRIQESIL